MRIFTSYRETAYQERLIEKYGRDVEKMARDRKMNPMQYAAGGLRRAIAKAGGWEKLLATE